MTLREHILAQGWTDADDILAEIDRHQRSTLLATWTLPWPPTVNTYFRNIVIAGSSRTLISKRGRQYAADVAKLLLGKPLIPPGFPLAVHVHCYPPDRRARDLDNLAKALLDALVKAGKLRDDSDVWDLRFTRECLSSPPGRVVVEIRQHRIGQEPLIPAAMVQLSGTVIERERLSKEPF